MLICSGNICLNYQTKLEYYPKYYFIFIIITTYLSIPPFMNLLFSISRNVTCWSIFQIYPPDISINLFMYFPLCSWSVLYPFSAGSQFHLIFFIHLCSAIPSTSPYSFNIFFIFQILSYWYYFHTFTICLILLSVCFYTPFNYIICILQRPHFVSI